ncbi:hypothetical protein E5CHR_03810 [Variovorax sp. PBL-E5]|nr:hypothetical protein E5CHR_03810 [Variovorax sp. PBL-E5]
MTSASASAMARLRSAPDLITHFHSVLRRCAGFGALLLVAIASRAGPAPIRIVPGLEEPLVAMGPSSQSENAALEAALARCSRTPKRWPIAPSASWPECMRAWAMRANSMPSSPPWTVVPSAHCEYPNSKEFGTAKWRTTDGRSRWIHGGGSSLGNHALDPQQGWVPTLGCTRAQNADVDTLCSKSEAWKRPIPVNRFRIQGGEHECFLDNHHTESRTLGALLEYVKRKRSRVHAPLAGYL